jgi:protein-tyrosine phosphatase
MRRDRPYRVCFVCSGNICRSPIAEVVLRALAERAGQDGLVEVDSAGIGDWHVGERADRRAVAVLAANGYDGSAHRARQFEVGDFADRDLVVALDHGHLRALRTLASTAADRDKIALLRSWDPALAGAKGHRLDVEDPYYDGEAAFVEVLRQVESACRGLLTTLER